MSILKGIFLALLKVIKILKFNMNSKVLFLQQKMMKIRLLYEALF